MAIGKILARGQLTLPTGIRRDAGIGPGDSVSIEVVGPGRIELIILPDISPRDLRDRYPIKGPIDEGRDRASWQTRAGG